MKPAAAPPASLASLAAFEPGRGKRGAGIALTSIGGLTATAGGILGLLANFKAADARGVPQIDRQAKDQTTADAHNLALAADLCYTAGAIVGATGIALIVLGALDATKPSSPEPATPSPSKPRRDKDKDSSDDDLSLSLAPTVGGAAIFVRGGF
jgi:hypothetical protein